MKTLTVLITGLALLGCGQNPVAPIPVTKQTSICQIAPDTLLMTTTSETAISQVKLVWDPERRKYLPLESMPIIIVDPRTFK